MTAVRVRQSSARIRVDGTALDLHYRVAGTGPALFLLHPSPLSSAFMVPLMQRLARRATLIAPDTPGFGASDPLPGPISDLAPCVRAMEALRAALGLEQVGVYGSATGAQIAVEWAKAAPGALSGVMLDNAATFDAAERMRIVDGYLPDVRPDADGGHLARVWRASHDATLFFPWQRPEPAHRIAPTLAPPEAMEATARGYLDAGPGYAAIYRAAFENERAERLQPIALPLVVLRWQGSILRRFTDRLDDWSWGPNVTMAHCGKSLDERWACLEHHLPTVLPQQAADAPCLDAGAIRYAASDGGQIRYRVPDDDAPPAHIWIPAPGASSASADRERLAPGTVCLDLPGHGGSLRTEAPTPASCVAAVRRVADALSQDRLTVAGAGLSAGIAEAAAADDERLHHRATDVPGYRGLPPALDAEGSGAHLFRGWHWLREQFLERDLAPPSPSRLTRMLLDLLDSRAAHPLLQERLGKARSGGIRS